VYIYTHTRSCCNRKSDRSRKGEKRRGNRFSGVVFYLFIILFFCIFTTSPTTTTTTTTTKTTTTIIDPRACVRVHDLSCSRSHAHARVFTYYIICPSEPRPLPPTPSNMAGESIRDSREDERSRLPRRMGTRIGVLRLRLRTDCEAHGGVVMTSRGTSVSKVSIFTCPYDNNI
jgi:hypothetical protein